MSGGEFMMSLIDRAPVLGSRDIRQVMAVAEKGSIRRAAEALGMTQPGLSKNLRLIEDRLGVSLFERSTSGVRLTPAGAMLVDRGRQVLLDLSAIERDIGDSTRGESGKVTVGLGMVVATELAADLLAEAHRLHPGISVDVEVQDPETLLEMLRSGRLDFGVFHLGPSDLMPELSAQVVLRTRPVVLVGAQHPLAGHTEVDPVELSRYRIAAPRIYPSLGRWLEEKTGGPLKPALVGSDYFQIGELLQQADAYTIASRSILRRLQRFFPLVELNVPRLDFEHVAQCVMSSSRPLSGAAQRILSLTTRILEQSRQDPQS
jgi:LysR family transcriptional regulator of abg operon